ncbi:MAG: hypothetical protein ACFFEF_15675 [Candidatus Thorarchaeota archaeon]
MDKLIVHNRNSFSLCILGGALMIASGASGTLGYLPELQEGLGSILGYSVSLTFEIIMGLFATLTTIGGFGVILGGVVLTTRYVNSGRVLVMLSMGAGTLSLIMTLVQLVMAGILVLPLSTQLTHSLGWMGSMLAIIARTISEQQPILS